MKLIVGADSEIGAALERLGDAGQAVSGTTRRAPARDRVRLDLAEPLGDWQPPAGARSACLCAAVTRLAACAADPAGSAFVNVSQTLALIDRLLARDLHVLFLSTDKVFDGATPQVPPQAPTAPASEYGRQKAAVEAALVRHLAAGAPVAILRLSKVVSPRVALLQDWARALAAGRPIRAFRDMRAAPVPLQHVVSAVGALMESRAAGIFQLSGPRDVSYAEVGRFVAGRVGADPALVEPALAAGAGLPPGSTPAHTTLDSTALCRRLGIAVADAWTVLGPLVDAAREMSDVAAISSGARATQGMRSRHRR